MRVRLQHRNRLTGAPNEIVVFLLVAASVTGGSVLFNRSAPSSIDATLPDWLRYGWALCLLVGGILGILGEYWLGEPFTGAGIKVAGLIAAGCASLAYATALLTTFDYSVAGAAALPNLGFGLACLARSVRISFLMLEVHRLARRMETACKDRA